MSKYLLLALLVFSSGCANMTEQEKRTAGIVVGVVVVGVLLSTSGGGSSGSDKACNDYITNSSIYIPSCP